MTKDEFEARYAAGCRLTVEQLREYGLTALPCDCGEPECDGWQMTSHSPLDSPVAGRFAGFKDDGTPIIS